MPKLKRKVKTKKEARSEPVERQKSEMDLALDKFRADPSYKPLPSAPESGVCGITGITSKMQRIVPVRSPAFTGWCCHEASVLLLRGVSVEAIKVKLSLKLRPRQQGKKLKKLRK